MHYEKGYEMKNYSTTCFYGPRDLNEFVKGVQHSVNQL